MAAPPPPVRCFCETWHNIIYTCSPWWPKQTLDACEAAVVKRVTHVAAGSSSHGGEEGASYTHDVSRLLQDVRSCLLEPVDASILESIAPELRGDGAWLRLRARPAFDDYPELREYIRARHRAVNPHQLVELLERGNDSSLLRMAVITQEQHPCKHAAGAFFNEDVPAGTILGAYAGMLVNKRVLPASYEWHYDLQAPNVTGFSNTREQGEYVFHGNTVRNAMCAVNDFTGIADEANVRKVPLILCGFLPMVLFVTARNCVYGEEACLSYGTEYRKQLQLERPDLRNLMVAPKTRKTETTTMDIYRSWTAPIQDRLRHRKPAAGSAATLAQAANDGNESMGLCAEEGASLRESPQSMRSSAVRAATPSSVAPSETHGDAPALDAHAGMKRARESMNGVHLVEYSDHEGDAAAAQPGAGDAAAAVPLSASPAGPTTEAGAVEARSSPSSDSVVLAAERALAAAHECAQAGVPSHALWLLMLQHRVIHARETAIHRTPQPGSRRVSNAARSGGGDDAASVVSASSRGAAAAAAAVTAGSAGVVTSPPAASVAALAAVTGPPRWEYLTAEEEAAMEERRRAKFGDFTLAELLQLSGTRRRATRGVSAAEAGGDDDDDGDAMASAARAPKPRPKRPDGERPRSHKKKPRTEAPPAVAEVVLGPDGAPIAPVVKPKRAPRTSWKGWALVSEEEAGTMPHASEPKLGDILTDLQSGRRRTRQRTPAHASSGSHEEIVPAAASVASGGGGAASGDVSTAGDAHANGVAAVEEGGEGQAMQVEHAGAAAVVGAPMVDGLMRAIVAACAPAPAPPTVGGESTNATMMNE